MRAPRIILVHPQNPANVGFVARLLANFGIAEWAIVGSPEALGGDAERTGAPAREVLTAQTIKHDANLVEDADQSFRYHYPGQHAGIGRDRCRGEGFVSGQRIASGGRRQDPPGPPPAGPQPGERWFV